MWRLWRGACERVCGCCALCAAFVPQSGAAVLQRVDPVAIQRQRRAQPMRPLSLRHACRGAAHEQPPRAPLRSSSCAPTHPCCAQRSHPQRRSAPARSARRLRPREPQRRDRVQQVAHLRRHAHDSNCYSNTSCQGAALLQAAHCSVAAVPGHRLRCDGQAAARHPTLQHAARMDSSHRSSASTSDFVPKWISPSTCAAAHAH